MATLITPPNTRTTLSASAIYDEALLQGELFITGPGTSVTILGVTKGGANKIIVSGGASIRFGGTVDQAAVNVIGSGASAEYDSIASSIYLGEQTRYSSTGTHSNATIKLSTSASIFGFQPGDSLRFSSPAVAFTVIDFPVNPRSPQGDQLHVREADGTTVDVLIYNMVTDYHLRDYVIADGALSVVLQPPQPPMITGIKMGQAVKIGETLRPFSTVTVTDPNTTQIQRINIKLNPVVGTLYDPDAATDGSTYDAALGIYTVSGLPSAVTAAINALVFTPTAYTLSAGQQVAGSATIVAVDSDGDSTSNASTTFVIYNAPTAPVTQHRPTDTDGNGTSDIVWQHSSGLVVNWSMNGASVTSANIISQSLGGFVSRGSGDFNGDGRADLLWQRPSDGVIVDWTMVGGRAVSGDIVASLGADWSLLGIGDFDGDGKSDLMWRSTQGQIVEWQMDGPAARSGIAIAKLGSEWTMLGTGDFNGDGKSDLLWRNTAGQVVTWDMSGNALVSSALVGAADSSWAFLGTSDLNADGSSDVLWRQAGTGLIAEWQMGPSGIVNAGPLSILDESWTFAGTGNFSGNGSTEILWKGPTGAIVEWAIDGFKVTAGTLVSTLDQSWTHVG